MKKWDDLVNGYIRQDEIRGLSESTIMMRTKELDRLGVWLKRRKPRPRLEDVNSELLIRYVKARTIFRSRSSVRSVIGNMRGMGEYLVREGVWQKNPLRWIRGPKADGRLKVPRRIGAKDMRRLWDAARTNHLEYSRHLGYCVLAILYGTGLRRGEMERLDLDDWNREEGTFKIDGHKTGRERKIPVGKGVWRCVEAYMPHRQKKLSQAGRREEQALLVNRTGERLKGKGISLYVHRLCKKTHVPLVSLHQFRHSCASDLLENGVSLPDIQKILGHAVITSTVRYAAVADPQRVEAMKKHPINQFLNGGKADE